jgi:uncharacterized protein (TIRG00374 family)
LVAAGAALLVALVRAIGVEALLADLRGFGAAMTGVVALELVIDACNTAAWRCTLPPDAPVGFGRLFWVRQAGVALNQLTPTATLGGEVAKAILLQPRIPVATASASLVAARMSYALAQAVIVLLGLAAVLGRLHDAPDLAAAVVIGFVLTVGGVLTFVWLQRRGIFGTLAAALRRVGLGGRLLERLGSGGTAVDARLAELYRERPRAFLASIAWHLAGQLIGLLQLAYILASLGVPTPLPICLALEAFALVLDSAAFLVPGRLGVQEAGRVLVFTTFGFRAATGLAVAVIVRLNQLAVAAIGLTALACLTPTEPSRALPTSQK